MVQDIIYFYLDFFYNDVFYNDSFYNDSFYNDAFYNNDFNQQPYINSSFINHTDIIYNCNSTSKSNFDYLTILVNILYYSSFLFTFLSTSIIFMIFFISKFIYYPLKKDFNIYYNKNPSLYDYEPFLFEYIDEYNSTKLSDISNNFLNILKYKFLLTNTPYGIIIMNYDYNNYSFDYYCKNYNTIPFEYLDTIARIYVVNYDCKKIYIESKNLNDDILEDEDSEEKNSINDKKKHVFYSKKSIKKLDKFVSNKFKYKGTFTHFNNLISYNNYNTLFISNTCNIDDCNIDDCNIEHCNDFIDPSNNSYNINYILNNFKDYHISNKNYLLFALSKNNDLSINNLHNINNINHILNKYITLNQENDLFQFIEPYELISSSNENKKISYSQFKNKS